MAAAGHFASPGTAEALTALKQALHGLQSGQKLVQLVRGAPNSGELASAVCACMKEACGELIAMCCRSAALQAPSRALPCLHHCLSAAGSAPTPADGAPCKQDLGSALSTTHVSCLHPRCLPSRPGSCLLHLQAAAEVLKMSFVLLLEGQQLLLLAVCTQRGC